MTPRPPSKLIDLVEHLLPRIAPAAILLIVVAGIAIGFCLPGLR